MKTVFQILVFLFISSKIIVAQNLTIEKIIPLNFSANNFSVNENKKFILLTSKENNEVIKIDLDGNVQKIIGGFGWGEGQFDYPSSIVSTAIDVYVSDYNNHRIQRFDHNLNYISSLQKSETINFEYPISICLSSLGDLYILDSYNKRILKVNGFNRLERVFGNYESGRLIFSNPSLIRVDNQQQIYVLDGKNIFVFDQFGIYLKTITLPEDFSEKIVDFYPGYQGIFLLTSKSLYELNKELKQI
ncbi:MAG: NHL repeat-containing protein, partial [Ignavibacteria bacterium]